MNDLERMIYSKGLESAYGNVLLGDEERALSCIENLVYLTRELDTPPQTRQSLSAELEFIKKAGVVCWPDRMLEIRLEEDPVSFALSHGQLANPVIRALETMDDQGTAPLLLRLWIEKHTLHYVLSDGERIRAQGGISGA